MPRRDPPCHVVGSQLYAHPETEDVDPKGMDLCWDAQTCPSCANTTTTQHKSCDSDRIRTRLNASETSLFHIFGDIPPCKQTSKRDKTMIHCFMGDDI